ncbi:MAG: TolC family protein [Sedimentisphaerales bacterium]|nr:TolC family protein [Sedimentisphaerales bacterium]HNY76945.1 TolC family protein [Sedimentisphaerales bacterium]
MSVVIHDIHRVEKNQLVCVRTWRAAWLLAGLVLAGCGSTQVRRTPELEALAARSGEIEKVKLADHSQSEPVTIEQATEEQAAKAAEPDAAPHKAVELTLEEARADALTNNLDLKFSLVGPSLAQQTVDEERAKFEWTFFGSAGYSRREQDDEGNTVTVQSYEAGVEAPLQTGGLLRASLPFSRADTSLDNVDGVAEAAVSVSYVQSLLRGAGTRINTHSIRIATYQKDITDAYTKLSAIAILANVDIVYWQLYAARRELDVRREQYKLAEDQLDHARRKVGAGAAAKIEIVRAEAGLAGRLEDVINAETSVRDCERDLKRILNREDLPLSVEIDIIPTSEPDPIGLDLDAEAIVAVALDNRMEMAELEFQLAVDDLDIELARNRTLPDVTFDYTYATGSESGSLGSALGDIGDGSLQNHAAGISAVIPLGNRAAQARYRRARLEKVRDRIDQERLRQSIRQEIYNAVDELRQNWRRILAAEQGVVTAYRDYKVEQSQFTLGKSTSTFVLQSASRLADAQSRRIRAFAEYEIAQVRLARATGTLLGHGRVQLHPSALEDNM